MEHGKLSAAQGEDHGQRARAVERKAAEQERQRAVRRELPQKLAYAGHQRRGQHQRDAAREIFSSRHRAIPHRAAPSSRRQKARSARAGPCRRR